MKRILAILSLLMGCGRISLPTDLFSGHDSLSTADDFRVHEWGTFTSVVRSTGFELEGLHHEEERLPEFVYGRAALNSAQSNPHCNAGDTKCVDTPPGGFSGVTQKLETPVIYFYGTGVSSAIVHVDFPTGLISQWYPNAQNFYPPLGPTPIAQGSMDWHIQLVPGLGGFPEVPANDIWAPSRRVRSIPVKVAEEHEQFIFYRGLGSFMIPELQVTAHADGTVSLVNHSTEEIQNIFMLHVHNGGGAIQEMGPLAQAQAITHMRPPAVEGKESNLDQYVVKAQKQIATALIQDGLTDDEAQAMVDTWSKSYFRSHGLRFLYLVPRTWIDRLLPIQITPVPQELVRVFIGRVDVLTQAEEQQALLKVQRAYQQQTLNLPIIEELGRFAEPKLRRVRELTSDEKFKSYCTDLIALANQSR